ncbi:hypothetical protein BHE74_00034416 [Ensete ventricosum]|uniref:Uncharacterized protein n=1 Tax=Ensete ventricosum TaxID=4639 RepID=A0A445MAQ5_ENSVE|nr:hypothetical protein BHE74_00034416 [Ensete ventricosum]RZR71299.1 hypothetical protein BHM03_00004380 [Ensete ventricosum]
MKFLTSALPGEVSSNPWEADALARLASADTADVLPAIPSLRRPMTIAIEMTTTIARPDWREEILHYKRDANRTPVGLSPNLPRSSQ